MLNSGERRALRARAHALKPVVLLGQHGLTEPVFAAIEEALHAHELIKVKLRGIERDAREALVVEVATRVGADVVNIIGHMLTLYRVRPAAPPPAAPARKPARPRTPKAARAAGAFERERQHAPRARRTSRSTSSRRGPR
ncbi:MAG: YhbY family RNA-binding protein [Gammaproteobacteria bacterium]